jgi:hypothetical protein
MKNTLFKEARMIPRARAQILAEINVLREQQTKDVSDAVFGGLTSGQEAAHRERADRLERLLRELDTLDELPGRSA